MTIHLKTLPQVLAYAADNQILMTCYSDEADEPDYQGPDKDKALEALEACDEMHLRLTDANGKFLATLFIVNGLDDPEEQIADYTACITFDLFSDPETR